MTVMRYSMAVDRLRTIAETCTRLASLWEDDPLVVGAYVFGELLEGSQRPERLQLAFVVDLPPDEVTWYTQPTPMAGFAATVGIDKYPCEWYSRPALERTFPLEESARRATSPTSLSACTRYGTPASSR